MNRKLPLTPHETDALLYVIISILLLITVNQVLGQSQDGEVRRDGHNVSERRKSQRVERSDSGTVVRDNACREAESCRHELSDLDSGGAFRKAFAIAKADHLVHTVLSQRSSSNEMSRMSVEIVSP